MFDLIDVLFQKRRFTIACIVITASLLIVCLLAPLAQAHSSSITARIQSSYDNQTSDSTYDSPNAVTNAFSQIADSTTRIANTIEVRSLSGIMSFSATVTRFNKDVVHGVHNTATFTLHTVIKGAADTSHAIGNVFGFTGHTTTKFFGLLYGLSHVNSIIHPRDHSPMPTITQLRIQQAALIQSDTKSVSITPLTSGFGGACDNGNGTGGYPANWCNAPMDSVLTVSYSSDRINRECTSYAYWYFTNIEGHTDFRVSGNAKYWATTSNYPIHATPAVGAMAVETKGAYGHVAIVQALAGQKYAGQVVPAGFVLVSEMNYDWNGHFRYSYSSLGKFSAYIYP